MVAMFGPREQLMAGGQLKCDRPMYKKFNKKINLKVAHICCCYC